MWIFFIYQARVVLIHKVIFFMDSNKPKKKKEKIAKKKKKKFKSYYMYIVKETNLIICQNGINVRSVYMDFATKICQTLSF